MNDKFRDKMNSHSELLRAKKAIEKKSTKSEKGINIYSYVLSAICAVLAILFFIYGSPLLGGIFLGIGGLLSLVVYLSVKVEKKEQEKEKNKKD